MTDLNRRDREALVLGDARGALTAADLALLTDVLAAPGTWAEPGADLEDSVVRAVTSAEPERSVVTPLRPSVSRRRRARPRKFGVAAAAVVGALLAAGPVLTRSAGEHPRFKTDLSATALARGAGAEVEMYHSDAGFRVTLDAHGLPALPAGEYYEAWLRSSTGTVVPIGTFSSSDGHVTLWSGVSAREFPIFSVTVEPTDGELAPSDRRVLVGVLHAT
jgi:hypothetical protein